MHAKERDTCRFSWRDSRYSVRYVSGCQSRLGKILLGAVACLSRRNCDQVFESNLLILAARIAGVAILGDRRFLPRSSRLVNKLRTSRLRPSMIETQTSGVRFILGNSYLLMPSMDALAEADVRAASRALWDARQLRTKTSYLFGKFLHFARAYLASSNRNTASADPSQMVLMKKG